MKGQKQQEEVNDKREMHKNPVVMSRHKDIYSWRSAGDGEVEQFKRVEK